MIGMMKRRGLVFGIVGVFVVIAIFAAANRLNAQNKAAQRIGTAAEGVDLASSAAVLKAARTYVGNQELGKAQAVLRAALKDRPDDAIVRGMLGDVLLQDGDEDEAMAQYAAVADRDDATGEALFRAGSLAAGMDDHARALGYLTRAGEIDPGNAAVPALAAGAQIDLGLIDEAKVNLARAAVLDEGQGVVWGMLAELAVRENKLDMASQHIVKARRFEPDVIAWRVLEARIYKRLGDPEKAIMLLDGIGRADRFEPSVIGEMAACLGMVGRAEDAMLIYQVAVREKPTEPELWYQAALWAERLGMMEEAADYARSASMLGDKRATAVLDRLED